MSTCKWNAHQLLLLAKTNLPPYTEVTWSSAWLSRSIMTWQVFFSTKVDGCNPLLTTLSSTKSPMIWRTRSHTENKKMRSHQEKGEKPPRGVKKRHRVRLTIPFIFWIDNEPYFIHPSWGMHTKLILLNIHPRIFIFSPYIIFTKNNGP